MLLVSGSIMLYVYTKNISVVGGLVYPSPLLEKESKGAEIAKGKGRARARERGQAETGGTKELQFFQLTSPPQHCRLLPARIETVEENPEAV